MKKNTPKGWRKLVFEASPYKNGDVIAEAYSDEECGKLVTCTYSGVIYDSNIMIPLYRRSFKHEIFPNKYYIFVNKGRKDVGILKRMEYDRGVYKICAIKYFTNGNGWSNPMDSNISRLEQVSKLFDIYECDNFKDIFTLIEDLNLDVSL